MRGGRGRKEGGEEDREEGTLDGRERREKKGTKYTRRKLGTKGNTIMEGASLHFLCCSYWLMYLCCLGIH